MNEPIRVEDFDSRLVFFTSRDQTLLDRVEIRRVQGGYKFKLYFDPEADQTHGKHYWITVDELKGKFSQLTDIKENITKVTYYTHALNPLQVTQTILHHAFLLLETKKWWWSLEKNSEGVTIQRSKNHRYVVEHYRREERVTGLLLGVEEKKSSKTRNVSLEDLIDILLKDGFILQEYDALYFNCQHFAEEVYRRIAM